ncbi:GatB/YqeY domain-containing protein [Desulfobotulus mexicanus]|uniref:Asn/Gln amidotransferase domain-containing protein n=1 Tax=Desulfobotulus mexicanus TaxID=2586642 RepID=A0A5S5MEQ8_9BACT|nr:GatB/YqeY domain-containing protein [Desulfobotulus mexicanus]TYT74158.1 hypothetical protein FIM25_11270 [Desulfobotulus mexicanus]
MEKKYGWTPQCPLRLPEKIREDIKVAMKQKDDHIRDALRMVISEFPKITVPITLESGKKSFRCKKTEEISNEDVTGLIRGLIKSEKILLDAKKETTSAFLEILQEYIPKPADEYEIKKWIEDNLDMGSLKNPSSAIGAVMKHFGARADGMLVKQILGGMVSS